tara:strand:- start:195 stop:902 length:708 start_codon:yes stop_codon:yes gene_type:complete
MKILFTGSNGRFGSQFKKITKLKNIIYPTKKEFNILKINSLNKYLKKHRPKIIIHAAGLSRPMDIHEKNINLSIDKNIIGTCNIVKVCKKFNIKLIYLSTNYVYPGITGNYHEKDSLLPYNNYAWSKLGGECAVQMYKNSLILRVCMTEKPFIHKSAFTDLITNFIFHEEVVKLFPKILKQKGILNIGGKTQSVYNFAKKFNKKIKGIKSKKFLGNKIPLNHSMNLKKLKKIIND